MILIQCIGVVHGCVAGHFPSFFCADLQLLHRVSGGDCAERQERGQVGTIHN